MAGVLKTKHWSIIQGQNHLKQLRVGPLHCETMVADIMVSFQDWIPLDNFDHHLMHAA